MSLSIRATDVHKKKSPAVLLFVQTHCHIRLSADDIKYFFELGIDCLLYLRNQPNYEAARKILAALVKGGESRLSLQMYSSSHFMFSAPIINRIRPYTRVIYIDSSLVSVRRNLTPKLVSTALNVLSTHPMYDQITFTPSTDDTQSVFTPPISNTYTQENAEADLFSKLSDHNNIFTPRHIARMKQKPSPHASISKTLALAAHSNYINNTYPQLNFKLQLSVFNVGAVFPVDAGASSPRLVINKYFEDVYSEYLELRGFTSENICTAQTPSLAEVRRQLDRKPPLNTDPCENVTIVTAFIDLNITRPPKKNIKPYDYFDQSKQTLSIRQNMVIFVSASMVDRVYEFRRSLGLKSKTKIIEVNARDHLYMLDQLPRVACNIDKNVPPYNIPKYIMAVNSRYNLIQRAIDMNVFGSDYFAWVDFSAGHIVDIPADTLIRYNNEHKIRLSWIGRISGTGEPDNPFYFKYNYKCCGGGVFVGHKYMMTELIRIHHEEFVRLMDAGYCINDDKLLFIIFEKYPRLFDMYVAGYKNLMTKL